MNTQNSDSRIIRYRSTGQKVAPTTSKWIDPGPTGELLKPFVYLDLSEITSPAFELPLHPHSGVATLTYVWEGLVTYVESNGHRGALEPGALEWMQAGGGVWHGGGIGDGYTKTTQMWVSLPPNLELEAPVSHYLSPAEVPCVGPARVLLGELENAKSPISLPWSMTCLAIELADGDEWTYVLPKTHQTMWIQVIEGSVVTPTQANKGELIVFDPTVERLELKAIKPTQLLLGSAAPYEHALVAGQVSVHTSTEALRLGQENIARVGRELSHAGQI